jgi:hypothetical protein
MDFLTVVFFGHNYWELLPNLNTENYLKKYLYEKLTEKLPPKRISDCYRHGSGIVTNKI